MTKSFEKLIQIQFIRLITNAFDRDYKKEQYFYNSISELLSGITIVIIAFDITLVILGSNSGYNSTS